MRISMSQDFVRISMSRDFVRIVPPGGRPLPTDRVPFGGQGCLMMTVPWWS